MIPSNDFYLRKRAMKRSPFTLKTEDRFPLRILMNPFCMLLEVYFFQIHSSFVDRKFAYRHFKNILLGQIRQRCPIRLRNGKYSRRVSSIYEETFFNCPPLASGVLMMTMSALAS